MKNMLRKEGGFTLVELLIVVIILGILAGVVIPQFTSSTEDAKLSALDSDLGSMRNAIELYYTQHDATYPGANRVTDGNTATASECATAFVQQLTRYSASTGVTAVSKDDTYKYGPYVKKGALSSNPFNALNSVLCDVTTTDITAASSDGTTGWKFYALTGRLIANDGVHDTN